MTLFKEIRNQLLISNDESETMTNFYSPYDWGRSNNLDLRLDFFPDFDFDDLEDDD